MSDADEFPDAPTRGGTERSNLSQLVGEVAPRRPDAVAIVEPATGRRLTWAELGQQIDVVASGLASGGLVAGHRIGLQGRNSTEFVIAYLAALRVGLVVVPVDPEASADDARRLLATCGVRLLLVEEPEADVWNGPRLDLSAHGLSDLASRGQGPAVSPPDREALAVLVTTAGTSGEPKIVMLTHRALLEPSGHEVEAGTFRLQPDDVLLGALPFFGIFGLASVIGAWLSAGASLVVIDHGSVDLVDIVRAEQVTHLPVTPTMLYRVLDDERLLEALGSVRTVVSAGAPLPWRLAQSFTTRTGLRVEQGYGLTEAARGVSATFGGPILGPSHVGRPLPGVEVRIGNGSDVGEPAEIAVRGDTLFSGYWPNAHGGPEADGWFRTGDIGYLRDGELFLVDRARELVVVHGFTVYPSEVEETIRRLPEVRAVAVVGRPAQRSGQELVAFTAGRDLTPDSVLEHCAATLPAFKRPAEVRLVDDLPRGVTGMVKRAVLRRMLAEPTAS